MLGRHSPNMKNTFLAVALFALLGPALAQHTAPAGSFATVDGVAISSAEYDAALSGMTRQKFYHRAVPEPEMEEFRREVADSLIDRVLVLNEALRRGIAPDGERVRKTVAEYDARYAQSEQWKQNRETLLPGLTKKLEEMDIVERLQASVRASRAPTDGELAAYYEAHRDQFTQPEQVRVSAILLKVEPSSPAPVWAAAQEEAQGIRARIVAGADFASLARMHSHDPSAAKGGDMGYLHKGTMPEGLHEKLVPIKPGEITEPIRLLEGIALLRLEDRQPPRLRNLEDVKERAVQLWQREQGERAWSAFRASLRAAASIRVDTARYPSLAGAFPAGTPAERAR